jgi:IS1 family transposase
MFHVGKPSLLRFIRETNLAIERMELDQQWAYVHTHKERMSRFQKANLPGRGDCWLWAALDSSSKAIVNWTTGKRSASDRADYVRASQPKLSDFI